MAPNPIRGGTSSGALLMFKSCMQDIECAIKDRNINNDEALKLTDNADINCECDKVEQEKCKLAEELERTKTEYEQALASKRREVSLEIEQIKKHMEEQM